MTKLCDSVNEANFALANGKHLSKKTESSFQCNYFVKTFTEKFIWIPRLNAHQKITMGVWDTFSVVVEQNNSGIGDTLEEKEEFL